MTDPQKAAEVGKAVRAIASEAFDDTVIAKFLMKRHDAMMALFKDDEGFMLGYLNRDIAS